jgi:hypothetical protein
MEVFLFLFLPALLVAARYVGFEQIRSGSDDHWND